MSPAAKRSSSKPGTKRAPAQRSSAQRATAPRSSATAGGAGGRASGGRPAGGRSSGSRPASGPAPSSRGGPPRSAAAEKAIAGKVDRQRDRSAAGRRKADAGIPERGSGRSAGGKAERGAAKDRGIGGEQVEGRQAVRELLLAGRRRVKEVWVATRESDDPNFDDHVDDLAELADSVNVPVREVSRKKLLAEARTESPQGVLAKAAPLPEVELDELLARRDPHGRPPFLVAVDGVTDPGNLGALLRSAEGAGATGVLLPRHRAVHITPTVTKAAAGAVEYLPMAVVGGLPAAIVTLQRAGIWVVGLDMDGEPIHTADLPADAGICLVLGSEGQGLSRLVRERCDLVVSLPLRGNLASLNVAAAAAVACYEVTRRRP